MTKPPWLLILRSAALLALSASAALLSDYLADSPSFCGAASGCGAVRASPYSHVSLGDGGFLPLPVFGVVGFAVVFVASLLWRPLMLVAAGIGGAASLWLLALQAFVLQRFCSLCVTTDVAGVVAAGAALAIGLGRAPSVDGSALLPKWSWWALFVLALGAPLLWPSVKAGPSVPSKVRAYYVPNKINIVEFADFQCPACRRFHGILKPILKAHGDRVHFVRLNKPLSGHIYARDAARAAVCAEAQGKLEIVADALFEAHDLSPAGIDRIAERSGVDSKAFESCLLDPATEARIDREATALEAADFEGLPTTYIGSKRLLGVRAPEEVEDAIERAARGEGVSGLTWYVYLPIVALLGLLLVRSGLRSRTGR